MGMYVGKKKIAPVMFKTPSATININENGKYDVKNYANAVVNVGSRTITVKNIPDALNKMLTAYYLVLNEDEILYSISESKSTGKTGLWHYRVSTEEWTQIIDKGYGYEYMYQITDTKWILGSKNYSILVYDYSTNSARQLINDGLKYLTWIDDDRVIITTYMNSKTLVYYISTDTYIDSGFRAYTNYPYFLGGTKWIMITNQTTLGIIYDSSNDSFIQIANSIDIKQTQITKLTDSKYRFNKHLYDMNDDSCSEVFPRAFVTITKINDNKFLCASSGTSSADRGLYLLNLEDKSCNQFYTTGVGLINHKQVTENKFIVTTNSSSYEESRGIFLYNSTDDSVTRIYNVTSTSSFVYNHFVQVTDTKYILTSKGDSSTYYNAYGFLLYNSDDDSVVSVYTSGQGWPNWYKLSDTEWLCYQAYNAASTNVRTIYLLNLETLTMTSTINNVKANVDVRIFEENGELYLAGINNEYKLLFNKTDKKFYIIEFGAEVK